jgi:tRNA U34 5-methylaminomethyl-2-thiouridine-forming methyltransferase MnmC
MTDQQADIEWRDSGVPLSVQFDDPYYSLDDGIAETRHVFLDGNDLPGRFEDGFHVVELGFGTGLNFLVTLAAWRASGATGRLQFTSFEAFPMPMPDLRRALSAFNGLPVDPFDGLDAIPAHLRGPDFELSVVMGDVRSTLPMWAGRADAWYLDGFSPAKNPEMWGADVMAEVARHTAADGTVATYTAAGFVRRALADGGFSITRTSGFGRKRHMIRGRM